MSEANDSVLNSEPDLASIPMAQGGLTRLAIPACPWPRFLGVSDSRQS